MKAIACIIVVLAALLACEVKNYDHCLHQAPAPNAWCAQENPARAFCSPCVGSHHGCVAAEPSASACAEYEPDPTSTTTSDDGSNSSAGSSSSG